jgi:hypothetical protein
VVTLLRPPSLPAGHRAPAARSGARRRLLTLACLALLLSALAFGAAPAGALITGSVGVQLRERVPVNEALPLQYHGGPIMHSSDAYVVYWDPIGNYRGDWEELIERYFQGVGAESGQLGDVFALDAQYTDAGGKAANQSTFRGGYKDEDPYPTSGCTAAAEFACLSKAQIETELQHLITSVDPPLPGATGPPVYYVLTPPGVTVCTGGGSPSTCSNSSALEKEVEEIRKAEKTGFARSGICGYHSAVNLGGASPIPFAVQPWVAGNAGLLIESFEPLVTSGVTGDALACQNGGLLEEPNQLGGLNPWGAYAEGLADLIISDLSVEQQNIVVDPFFNGWYQNTTNAEQGDMCQRNFGPPPEPLPTPNKQTHAANLSNESINGSPYYVQWAFNSSGVSGKRQFACWAGVTLDPAFTSANPVNSGDIVGFNGTESNVTLDARASRLGPEEPYRLPVYSWDFGDGSTASGPNDASEFHSYVYGGSYAVTLTVTDGGGNTEHTTRTITVDGPPPPTSVTPATSGSSTTGAGAGAGARTGASGKPGGGPVATAAVVSRSLSTVLRNGLVVRYSVNGQVAGRFEVLLASSIARRIGLNGAPATGLAKGTPPQIVIAKAILVTTKGGHSTYKIKFSKATAARLRRLRKVSLMLRLIVHNASSPTTTTVINTVNLSH